MSLDEGLYSEGLHDVGEGSVTGRDREGRVGVQGTQEMHYFRNANQSLQWLRVG